LTEQVSAPALTWRGFARSVQGASHVRRGAPNQDAGGTAPLAKAAGIVLAVADGHGDKLHARSERGSRFAVSVALDLVVRWIGQANGAPPLALIESAADLKVQLIDNWRAAVDADLEVDRPRGSATLPGGSAIDVNQARVLYGTTLIVAALTDTCAVYFQIGDGDLLAVTSDGHARLIFPADPDLPLNRTDSLCQADAIDRLRVCVEPFEDVPAPELVQLSTDGYANSFSDDGAFLQVAQDLKAYVASRGLGWVAERAENWLTETSASGSGDDITLAVAWRGAPTPANAVFEQSDVDGDVDESARQWRWSGSGHPRVVSRRWTRKRFVSAVTSGVAVAMLIATLASVLAPLRFSHTTPELRPTPAASPTATTPVISNKPSVPFLDRGT
jgi:Protein phosphatase 2C